MVLRVTSGSVLMIIPGWAGRPFGLLKIEPSELSKDPLKYFVLLTSYFKKEVMSLSLTLVVMFFKKENTPQINNLLW